jgi:hypothetical protein
MPSKLLREPWYGAKCLFLHRGESKQNSIPCYEERITLVKARGFEGSVRKGEAEAKRYAAANDCDYLGFIEVFNLFERRIGDGSEVFSIMRSIRLSKKQFIDKFYDDGTFHDLTLNELKRLKPRKKPPGGRKK